MFYIVIYNYLDNDGQIIDGHIVYSNIILIEKFLKNLCSKYPNANVYIFKGCKLELSDFYEFETKA